MEAHTGGTKITCPHCGAENPLLAIACQNCGSSLVDGKGGDPFREVPQPKIDRTYEEDIKPGPPPVPLEAAPVPQQEPASSTAGMAEQQPSSPSPAEPTIPCPRCGLANPTWRSICERCQAPLRYGVTPPQTYNGTQPQSFGASLGVGCLTMLIANITNNLLTIVLALIFPSVFSSSGSVWCSIASLIVIIIIAFSITGNIVKKKRSGMNGGGVALAIIIAVIIIIIMTASGVGSLTQLGY